MRRIDIITMYRVLCRVKLNKVDDKELRNALIGNHLKMFRVVRENDEYVTSLREQFDPEAVKDLNEAYHRYAEETVDIDLTRISPDSLGDVLAKSDIDFTLAEMSSLEPLFQEE